MTSPTAPRARAGAARAVPCALSVSFATLFAASASSQLSFTDVAAPSGVLNSSHGRASAMVDLDGDGRLDLVAANAGTPNRVYRQLPDHTFVETSAAWGITPDNRSHWSALAADFDEDGDIDLFFVNGGFFGGPQTNQVLRNDLSTSGVFTDVSDVSGDGDQVGWDFGGTAFDYDLDGDVDVFVTRVNGDDGCALLRNDGDLVFTDVSAEAGVDLPGNYRHCTSGDFDNDGWIDVAVGRSDDELVLFRNDGDGTFTDVAVAAGIGGTLPDTDFGLVLEDFDNDGWLDLYVPKYQFPTVVDTSRLFRNAGDGTFVDVTAGSGMTGQTDMGHTTGDLDADGYPDIYIGTGHPVSAYPDVMFRVTPDGAGGFIAHDVTASAGVAPKDTRCHGMALGDYDGDGDVDIYVNNGGPQTDASTVETDFLWANDGNDHGWTAIGLVGVVSNRGGVGARAVARTGAGREVHRHHRVGHGFGNTNSPVQHFGVGSDDFVERIDVRWPSGIEQVLLAPPMSTTTTVVETGALGGDAVEPGETYTLLVAGTAGHVATTFVGVGLVEQPLPAYGGVWNMAAPFVSIGDFALGADGVGEVPLPVPTGFGLADSTFFLQSWIHAPGASSGGTLSVAVPLEIE